METQKSISRGLQFRVSNKKRNPAELFYIRVSITLGSVEREIRRNPILVVMAGPSPMLRIHLRDASNTKPQNLSPLVLPAWV